MAAMGPKRQVLGLVVLLVLCFGAAGIGGAVTSPQIGNWYATLSKPSWNPPNWVFGPVWSVLYLCMAVAAWLVWRQKGLAGAGGPLTLFGVQLALNTLWSCLFFGLHSPGVAFAEIILLWVAIVATTIAFWRRSVPAGLLFVPYLVWVTFAALLNFTLWNMNG